MPKLSSAETPPEKSRACLPVSTIAESGVITRIPLVCISIVASAFQYGWAPTLMPATTMLISPPAWVNSTIRLSAAATQSMFSVRSEERRVGKECRSRWSPHHKRKNEQYEQERQE